MTDLEAVLAQMKPGHAYRSDEISVACNSRGWRESQWPLRILRRMGYVERIETGQNHGLWVRTDKQVVE